ncbi:MAG TPA: chalcone isomerase family protein [Aquabacterium sp.]|nr:chalcone isomerase family protein [Aquabacterium sp.]
MKSFARALILSTALAAALPALAVDIKGVKFSDTAQVASQSLQLNGAGVRVKIIVDVYAAGLYIGKKDKTAAGAISQPGAKSVQIVLLRELTGEDFADAMIKGFKKNANEAEMAKYQGRLDELRNLMMSFGSVKKGTTIHMNLIPGTGMRVLVDGAQKGRDIPGDDFYAAILKIWLGSNPVDSDLKEALLGA